MKTAFDDPDEFEKPSDPDLLRSEIGYLREVIGTIHDALGPHRDTAPFMEDAVRILVYRYDAALRILKNGGYTEKDLDAR